MQDGKPYDFHHDLAQRIEGQLEAMAILRGVAVEEIRRIAIGVLTGQSGGGQDRWTPKSRTVNDGTRRRYRGLSETEQAQVESVEELGEMLIGLCHEIGGTDPDGERLGSRHLALAVTHIEDGVTRAVRHITR